LKVGEDEPECKRGRVGMNVMEEFRAERRGDGLVGAKNERFDVEFGRLRSLAFVTRRGGSCRA